MKNQGKIFLAIALLSVMLWSCSKNENAVSSLSLKQNIAQSAISLNQAMNVISSTKAFSILTVNDLVAKSATADSIYKVYISLDKIKGIYDYHPAYKVNRWGTPLLSYFNMTADDNQMIVRMPLSKVMHPMSLRHYNRADTLLTNNFEIAVSDYHNNYNNFHDFDYLLRSKISVDNAVAGNLNIDYFVSPNDSIKYASQYSFTDSYTANYKYQSGDTTISSFSIKDADKILYEEKLQTVRNDTARFGREFQYILTIGNIQIVRKSGVKGAVVFMNGVEQTGAVVSIIDNEKDNEASVCKKRDIQITFEDGTVTTVSSLLTSSIQNIKTLFESLHQVYFAAYVVDWIAYDIYYERN